MSTSLREQLQRLSLPQTVSLIDRKYRASILFDSKEAATKDRRTIYELGISGLLELITLNSEFRQFENTLFNETTIDLERAVEDTEVNELLNQNIKLFLQHLSPYFLLRPAHLCIEWLLRRFDIHFYNRNELMSLALPYHETNIFVRVLQTVQIKKNDDEWEWVRPLRKPGLPLPKSAIINRAASHAGFLAYISRSTVEVLKTFGSRAHMLQTHLNFFTTIVVGAYENITEFKEWHISNILESLLYCLSAKVVDVAAAGYIVAAQLVARTQLKNKLCVALLDRVLGVAFEDLRPAAVMLLILIFDVQEVAPKRFSQKALNIILGQKWLLPVIASLAKQNIEIYPVCAPLLRDAVHAVYENHEDADTFKRLALQLVNDVDMPKSSACQLINTFLDCYIEDAESTKALKLQDGDIIDLESDEDEGTSPKTSYKNWYSEYLRRLEQKYPDAFDVTIKEALSSQAMEVENRKIALKIALGYRLKMSNTDATDIYESLYHYNGNIRHLAMQTLVKNLSNYQTRFQNLQILKACLADRLLDDSRSVISELLKISPKDFIDILGYEQYAVGLLGIQRKIQFNEQNWNKLMPLVVQHLTSAQLLSNYDANLILLAVMPLLLPSDPKNVNNAAVEVLLKSELVKKFPFLKLFENDNKAAPSKGSKSRGKYFLKIIDSEKNLNTLPKPKELLESVKKQEGAFLQQATEFSNFLILLTACAKDKIKAAESLEIFEELDTFAKNFEMKQKDNSQKVQNKQTVSVKLYIECVLTLVRRTKFENLLNWQGEDNKAQEDLQFFLRIFAEIARNVFVTDKVEESKIWSKALVDLLKIPFSIIQKKIDFLINFFIDMEMLDVKHCSATEQLMAGKILNSILESKESPSYELNLVHLLKISNALISPHEPLRSVALETFKLIKSNTEKLDTNHQYFVESILEGSQEIIMDKEQFPLQLFVALKSPKKRADQAKASKILQEILQFLNTPIKTHGDVMFMAQILNALKHFTDEQTLIALVPLALKSLSYIKGEPALLPSPYNRILKSILQRMQAQNIESLLVDCKNTWKLFENIFKQYNVYMAFDDRELLPLPCVVLETLNSYTYERMPEKFRFGLIKLILQAEALAQNDVISLAAHKLLKNCPINCKPLTEILEKMYAENEESVKTPSNKNSSKRAKSTVQFNTLAWKEGVALLELLEHKEKLENSEVLIPKLFELLKCCLELDEQADVEYTKQLVLSMLLHCCRFAELKGLDLQKAFPKAIFRIDQIVQCVRATQNPQTHHNALTLLAHCAAHFPQQVLHNIVDIFTFMGSSVVRQDDAFSFHIIDKVIESVVPILVKKEKSAQQAVIPVLKVFSDILPDVPEHRLITLYTKLFTTLGVKEHFWRFLCISFEAQIVDEEKQRQQEKKTKNEGGGSDKKSKRMEIVMTLSNTFAPEIVLETCTNLLSYLKNNLPLSKEWSKLSDNDMDMDVETNDDRTKKSIKKTKRSLTLDDTELALFDVQHHSNKQLRHYKYIIMQFLSSVTKSPEFLHKIALLNEENTVALKPYFQNFIISILAYVPTVNAAVERFDDALQMKFWKIILHHVYDVLDNAISLLSPDLFLVVIIGLMKHKLLSVRKKVIDLLITKLQQQDGEQTYFLSFCTEERFRELIEPISDIVDGILVRQQQEEIATSSASASSNNELVFLQQTALIALKLLSKHFAIGYISEFKTLLANLTKILKNRTNISKIVLATVVLALVEIASNLKAHSLEQLPKFMPLIVELLQHQAESVKQQPPDHVCIAIITCVQKLFESLPRFLGPYIVNIIAALSSIATRISAQPGKRDQRAVVALHKVSIIWTKIAAEVYVRVLVPACEKSYEILIATECYDEVGELMKLLNESIVRASNEDLSPVQLELRAFFLNILNIRTELITNKSLEYERVLAIENGIIEALNSYILKLSESVFRPLYENMNEWALRSMEEPEIQVTFYRSLCRMSESLKSLFILFADKFIDSAALQLDKSNNSKIAIAVEDERVYIELLKAILNTLYNLFLHGTRKFLTQQRFETLMPKIVDQLENRLVLENEDVQKILISCVSQLAVVVSSDLFSKQLNYQVLLKTRTNVPEVRILSFNCCVEVARKLGDDFSTLLPETVPFIAELFEDENSRVEKNTRKAVQELESIVGESLQKYL